MICTIVIFTIVVSHQGVVKCLEGGVSFSNQQEVCTGSLQSKPSPLTAWASGCTQDCGTKPSFLSEVQLFLTFPNLNFKRRKKEKGNLPKDLYFYKMP